VLTTQYLEEADRLADHVVLIDAGRVVATGSPRQLKARVGRARFRLTTQTDADHARLCAALDGLVTVTGHLPRTVVVVLEDSGRLGLSSLRETIERAHAANVTIESYSLEQASLDDVFFQLTGHSRAEVRAGEEK